MAAQRVPTPSHLWIVLLCLAVQFALLIAAIVTVAVNRAMIEQDNTNAILPEGTPGVVVAYEIFWSIPLIITITEILLFLLYRHYPPHLYLISNIVKYMFAVAGLVLCVTRSHHANSIIVVVSLNIVMFLLPIIYGSIVYYKARKQSCSKITDHPSYKAVSADAVQAGGAGYVNKS